jgi:hypothetical protein
MPKEQRKRGRRAEKKRKLEKEEQEMELPSAPVENEYIYYQDLSGGCAPHPLARPQYYQSPCAFGNIS